MKLSGLLPHLLKAHKADVLDVRAFESTLLAGFTESNWGSDRPYEYNFTIKAYLETLPATTLSDPDFASTAPFINYIKDEKDTAVLKKEVKSLSSNTQGNLSFSWNKLPEFDRLLDFFIEHKHGELGVIALLGIIASDVGYTSQVLPSAFRTKLVNYIATKWPVTDLFSPVELKGLLAHGHGLLSTVHKRVVERLRSALFATEALFGSNRYGKVAMHITSRQLSAIISNILVDHIIENEEVITCDPSSIASSIGNIFYTSFHKLWKAVSVVPSIDKLKRSYDYVSFNTALGAVRVSLEAKFLVPSTKEELADVLLTYKDRGKILHHSSFNMSINPKGFIATGKLEDVISMYRSRYWVEFVFFIRGIAGTLTDDEIYWALTHTTNSNIQQGAMLFMRTMNTYHMTDLGTTEFKDLTVQTVQLSKSSGDIILRDVMDTQYSNSYAMYGVFASGE